MSAIEAEPGNLCGLSGFTARRRIPEEEVPNPFPEDPTMRHTSILRWLLSATLLAVGCTGSAVEAARARAARAVPRDTASIALGTGVRLHYLVQGAPAGRPVILLHGYTDSRASFDRVLPALPRSWRIYALDQRGHGRSSRPATGYGMGGMAADVLAFMDSLGIGRATLVGHSMGSFVARAVAEAAPGRVDRLVLVGTGVSVRNPVVREFAAAVEALADPVPADFVRDFQMGTVYHPVPDAFMRDAIAASLTLPASVWKSLMVGMLEMQPLAAGSPAAGIPSLLLWGERDAIFGRAEQDSVLLLLGSARLRVYPETGHAPHWERPAEFVRDLREFVAATPARSDLLERFSHRKVQP